MSIRRILAVILRFLIHFRHSFDRWVDVFYWPALDLILWGLTSMYFTSLAPEASSVTLVLVAGIVLWLLVYRGQYEISGNILEDVWSRNLVNLFISPLTFGEWTIGLLLIGLIKGLLAFAFAIVLAWFLYQVQVFALGFYLLPFLGLLILSGWWLGFIIASLILRFGTRVQAFAWTAVWVVAPFCAIYYPMAVLPGWAQMVSRLLPISYVFEGARQVLQTGSWSWNLFLLGLFLNFIYFILALLFFRASFRSLLQKGLTKIH